MTEAEKFNRALAIAAAKRLPRYVHLLTQMLRRLPTDAELALLFVSVKTDAPKKVRNRRP